MIAVSLVKGESEQLGQSLSDDSGHETESDSSVDSESSVESELSSRLEKNRSLQSYYEEIANIVDHLFDVSILIRGVARNFGVSKAAAYVEKDAEGNDALLEFKRIVRLKIAGLGRYTPEWLVDRLTDTVGMRRQQFYYQKAHKLRLSKSPPVFDEEAQIPVAGPSASSRPIPLDSVDPIRGKELMTQPATPAAPRTEKSKSTAKTYATIATEPIPEEEQATITTLPKPTKTEIAESNFPRAPKEPSGKAFECPQCFIILPDSMRRENLWMLSPLFVLTNFE